MRLLHVIILLMLSLSLIYARSIISTTTTTSSLQTRTQQNSVENKFDSIRYNVADTSQIDIQVDDSEESTEDEEGEDTDEASASSPSPTADQAFLELSRQAFLHLNQGEQYVKPVLETEEQRRLLWLSQHQDRKESKADNQLPGKRQVMTLTSADNLDRNQTCYGERFKHKIKMAGCEPKIIINMFCHGACTSFYIPKLRSKKLKATFKSCAACVPVETDYVKVQLDCPERAEGQMFRTVVRVKRCACRNIQFGDEDEEE